MRIRDISIKLIRIVSGFVDFALLTIILLIVALGSYVLWDTRQIYKQADSGRYEIYKPTPENGAQSFEELREMNPEVFSWLTVYGTHIDYPVVQGEDNWKYVSTDAIGKQSVTGNIFLDSINNPAFSDFNSILYGHHMEKQTMFGEIGRFAEQEYFDARAYGNLYFNGKDHGLEFFAFLHVDAYDASVFTAAVENKQQYLDYLLEQAIYTRDIGVSIEDRIVLLSTCSPNMTNGRDILAARISDTLFKDSFAADASKNTQAHAAIIDKLHNTWLGIAGWVWLLLIIFILSLLLLLAFLLYRKNKKKKLASFQ